MSIKNKILKWILTKELLKMINELKGIITTKTVWVGIAMIGYALFGFLTGHLPQDVAIKNALEGLGFITVRSAIAKK